MIMLAKGNRSKDVTNACAKYGGFYLGSIGILLQFYERKYSFCGSSRFPRIRNGSGKKKLK